MTELATDAKDREMIDLDQLKRKASRQCCIKANYGCVLSQDVGVLIAENRQLRINLADWQSSSELYRTELEKLLTLGEKDQSR